MVLNHWKHFDGLGIGFSGIDNIGIRGFFNSFLGKQTYCFERPLYVAFFMFIEQYIINIL